MRRVGVFALTVGLLAAIAWSETKAQEDAEKYWPQWRGPLATGVAPLGDPPTTWSEQENVKWKVACPGDGGATPIVWGDKIFILAAVPADAPAAQASAAPEHVPLTFVGGRGGMGGGRGGMGGGATKPVKFQVLCLDRETGKVLWEKTAREAVPHEGHHDSSGYDCYSPVTDGTHVYAYFGSWGMYCYDLDGNRKWDRDLGPMTMLMSFGEGGSPVLCGDKIIVKRDHEGQSSIVAMNKLTGDVVWSKDRDEGTSWSTPLVVEVDGKPQIITTATNKIRAYNPDNGDVIWECGGMTRNVIPTPVAGFGMVFPISGFQGNSAMAIQLSGRTGDLTGSDAIKWRVTRATPYVPSPLLYGDMFYFLSNNNPILSCYQAETGEAVFTQKQLPFQGRPTIYASPVGAADRVYLPTLDGQVMVIKRSKEFEVLATNTLSDGFEASPAIVGKEMFLRGRNSLYCLTEN